jgi:hypothetical protein
MEFVAPSQEARYSSKVPLAAQKLYRTSITSAPSRTSCHRPDTPTVRIRKQVDRCYTESMLCTSTDLSIYCPRAHAIFNRMWMPLLERMCTCNPCSRILCTTMLSTIGPLWRIRLPPPLISTILVLPCHHPCLDLLPSLFCSL